MSTNTLSQYSSIAALRDALAQRQTSATELAQDALANIKAQTHLNAFLHVDTELTLLQAKAADARIAAGDATALTGIPIAHKDNLVTQDWRTTAASKMLEDYVSPFDATVVQRLNLAGTVSLGKLNCDEFGMGSYSENSAFGPVRNPWNTDTVSGGSSGGSAAAVAAGLITASTATDTGGSVRQPSALCGVSGIKPTYGTVSRFGIVAYGSSLDQAGVIARNASDLMEVLDTISGFDPHDATSLETCNGVANAPGRIRAEYKAATQTFDAAGAKPLQGLRIGLPREYFDAGLNTEVGQAIETALQTLESLGAVRVDISLPLTRLSIPAYYVIAPAEASSNLSRFDGVRYGHRATQYTDLESMTARSRSEAFGPEVKRRIIVGNYVLSHGYYDAYYLQAQRVRRMIANDFSKALSESCDIILGPVSANTAKRIGENCEDPTAAWLSDIYTLGVSLAGLPAMSIPCGFSNSDKPLPIGMQLIGNYFNEGRLLAIADRFQQHTDWHQRKPGQH